MPELIVTQDVFDTWLMEKPEWFTGWCLLLSRLRPQGRTIWLQQDTKPIFNTLGKLNYFLNNITHQGIAKVLLRKKGNIIIQILSGYDVLGVKVPFKIRNDGMNQPTHMAEFKGIIDEIKQKDEDYNDLISHISSTYRTRYNTAPTIPIHVYTILNKMVRKHGLEIMKRAWDEYIQCEDEWYKVRAHNVKIFVSSVCSDRFITTARRMGEIETASKVKVKGTTGLYRIASVW